jgi:nitrite reductase/ring-hydroxylating ferredoxin subunit
LGCNRFGGGCRSPAEGAYSEGFISSKLNQDYCIECPGTGSTFDFRTGEIKEWYPSNFVLRVLTPKGTCRNLETYPVRLEQVRSGGKLRALIVPWRGVVL